MPPKRGGRTTRAKAPTPLTPEQQQLRDQCDLLLKDFDQQCQSLKAESAREAKMAADSINTLYKLEIMKIDMEAKTMKWEEYYEQNTQSALGMSDAVADVVEDSVLEAVDNQVSQLKSAIKNTASKKGRKKKELHADENEPPMSSRSSRRRNPSKNDTVTETPSSAPTRGKSALETPANCRVPLTSLQTPMITPKFDISSMNRTVSRVARAGEVLVSLSGSPVAPASVGGRSKNGDQNALIPLGGGNTLNVPISEADINMAVDLDNEQIAKLDQLHRSLGNMLKMRDRNQISISGDIK